jgi:hypothetical protein
MPKAQVITDDADYVLAIEVAKTEIACTVREYCHDITPCADARLERKTKKTRWHQLATNLQSYHYIVKKTSHKRERRQTFSLRGSANAHKTH